MAKRWKKEPIPTGLARVCFDHDHRSSSLQEGGIDYASVNYSDGKWGHPVGWYWSCPKNDSLGITHQNTCREPVETEQEAKQAAKAHIDKCLKLSKKKRK